MPFPESQRVIYRRNPLDQVICQVSFPPVLRIEASAPAEFQEAIRDMYPRFEEQQAQVEGVPSEVASVLLSGFRRARLFEFSSDDGAWKIGLEKSALSLTCSGKYDQWENFELHLRRPLARFIHEIRRETSEMPLVLDQARFL